MSTIELAPCEYTVSPLGVLHLVSQNPEDYQTLCGVIVKNWFSAPTPPEGAAAVCFACRLELKQRQRNVQLGNYMAIEGVDRCECGSKHWLNDACTDCHAEWEPEARERSGLD